MRITNATSVRAFALAVSRESPGGGRVSSVSQELIDLCDVVARDAVIAVLRRAVAQHTATSKRLRVPK